MGSESACHEGPPCRISILVLFRVCITFTMGTVACTGDHCDKNCVCITMFKVHDSIDRQCIGVPFQDTHQLAQDLGCIVPGSGCEQNVADVFGNILAGRVLKSTQSASSFRFWETPSSDGRGAIQSAAPPWVQSNRRECSPPSDTRDESHRSSFRK
jgi:hypothetical protein